MFLSSGGNTDLDLEVLFKEHHCVTKRNTARGQLPTAWLIQSDKESVCFTNPKSVILNTFDNYSVNNSRKIMWKCWQGRGVIFLGKLMSFLLEETDWKQGQQVHHHWHRLNHLTDVCACPKGQGWIFNRFSGLWNQTSLDEFMSLTHVTRFFPMRRQNLYTFIQVELYWYLFPVVLPPPAISTWLTRRTTSSTLFSGTLQYKLLVWLLF